MTARNSNTWEGGFRVFLFFVYLPEQETRTRADVETPGVRNSIPG